MHICRSRGLSVTARTVRIVGDTYKMTPPRGFLRPMEPLGPHRPRAPEYTPTGGSLRPIGPGPSALAYRPWPMEPQGPGSSPYFINKYIYK